MIVATPYREGAALATAREAAKADVLERFYTTLYTGRLLDTLPRRLGGRVREESMRRAFPGNPVAGDRDKRIGRRGSRRAGPTHARAVRMGVKLHVLRKGPLRCRCVAHRLAQDDSEVVYGMFASSSRSYAAAKKAGKTTVLNFVNSHPTFQNTLLVSSRVHRAARTSWFRSRS